ncbi:MAG TPA: penicillin acylase family protein [Candidatus Cybelea sp.]|nr:penicillin acylase family protein [Candidatus Cybelea sp.]
MRRVGKWIGVGLLAIVALALIAAAGGYFWLRSSLPQVDGIVSVAGLTAKATIGRDDRGVATIRAASLEDAYFAIGFAHAQDRLFQMDLMRRAGAGRLSEVLGAATVPTDKLMRTLGLYAQAEQEAEDASPALKAALAAYSAGVNAYLKQRSGALPLEFLLLHYAPGPWKPADSLVWGRLMALQLSSNWNEERLDVKLKQTLPPDLLKLLVPQAESFAALPSAWFGPVGEASNNWVIAPSKSKTGAAILANDPHLGLGAPSIWYLAHIVTPEMSWVGATSPGMPMMVIGANDRVSWGFTTTAGDTEDLYEERLAPNDPSRYQTFYGTEPFAARQETIKVKDGKDRVVTIRTTHHGPVVSDLDDEGKPDDPVLALKAAFLQPNDRTADALLAMNLARSADELYAALGQFDSPQQNVVYADRDGHIGFVAAGRVPVRRKVYDDGMLPVPGWTDDYDWTGMIPLDGMPQTKDPASGWLATANNKIVDDNYAYFMAGRWPDDGRYKRIAELLAARPTLGVEDVEVMQQDTLSRPLLELVQAWLPRLKNADPKVTDLLKAWDGHMDRAKPAPLIATLWLQRTAELLLKEKLGKSYDDWWFWDTDAVQRLLADAKWCRGVSNASNCDDLLGRSLDKAVAEISVRLGSNPVQWQWGDLHRLHFRHPVLRYVPLLGDWLDANLPTDGDAFTINRGVPFGSATSPDLPDVHGPTMRLVVDMKNPMAAVVTLAGGQSGNPLSSHYADWLKDWRDGRYRPIVQSAADTLTLVPGN